MLNKIKHLAPTNLLKSLYYTLIHSYFNYGCLLWGNAKRKHLKMLETIQKKAVRIISKSSYNAPTTESFKRLSILKLSDVYRLQISQYMYAFSHNELLLPSLNHFFTLNNSVYKYSTRQSKSFHLPFLTYNQSRHSILYQGPKQWLELPQTLRESTTIKSFSVKLKKFLQCV